MKSIIAAAALAVLGLASTSLAGVTTVYDNDKPGWITDVGAFQTEDFNDTTLNPGVTVVSSVGSIGSGRWNDQLDGARFTEWRFNGTIFGWGANFDMTPGGAGTGVDVYRGDALIFTGSIDDGNSGQFWGFTDTDGFSKVRLREGTQGGRRETYNMDNMVYSNIVPLPPAAWLGLGLLGSLGLAGRLRRRRNG